MEKLDCAPSDVHVAGYQRIAAVYGNQCPMRKLFIITLAKFSQIRLCMLRMVVHPPVDLFRFQCGMKSFQQAKLLRGAVWDPHMTELILDEGRESLCNERRACRLPESSRSLMGHANVLLLGETARGRRPPRPHCSWTSGDKPASNAKSSRLPSPHQP